ncbi:hypothetical protein ACHAXT_012073 [Thalassiosira profunda]
MADEGPSPSGQLGGPAASQPHHSTTNPPNKFWAQYFSLLGDLSLLGRPRTKKRPASGGGSGGGQNKRGRSASISAEDIALYQNVVRRLQRWQEQESHVATAHGGGPSSSELDGTIKNMQRIIRPYVSDEHAIEEQGSTNTDGGGVQLGELGEGNKCPNNNDVPVEEAAPGAMELALTGVGIAGKVGSIISRAEGSEQMDVEASLELAKEGVTEEVMGAIETLKKSLAQVERWKDHKVGHEGEKTCQHVMKILELCDEGIARDSQKVDSAKAVIAASNKSLLDDLLSASAPHLQARRQAREVEREFEAVFGSIFGRSLDLVNQVRSDDPKLEALDVSRLKFRDPLQWKLLGRFLAKNTHLRVIEMCGLTGQCMSHFFSELPKLSQLETLTLHCNDVGRVGIEKMSPFLANSCKLVELTVTQNDGVDDDCFNLIVGALAGGSIERLTIENCDVEDITALRNCTLPNLKALDLRGNMITAGMSALVHVETMEELCLNQNDIGLEQCIELTSLLRNQYASLRMLGLQAGNSSLCDESIEALAGALKHNSTLEELDLRGNTCISERGCLALLSLLNDVSSIANTYHSNHTLIEVKLPDIPEARRLKTLFQVPLGFAMGFKGSPRRAGRMKVIYSHFESSGRKEMYAAQGIANASFGSIIAGIDPILLPDILALVWATSDGRDDLFNAMVETAPKLVALIDRRSLLENLIAKRRAHIAALTEEADALDRRLLLLESGVGGPPKTKGGGEPEAKKMRIG